MSDKPQWRCGTCRHKRENEGGYLKHICTAIKGPQDYEDDDFVLNEQLAFSVDASGHLSDFEVTDDFGCVLWEQKK